MISLTKLVNMRCIASRVIPRWLMLCKDLKLCLTEDFTDLSRIMFMREFPVIDSAVSVEQLRMRLKDSELEQYGEAFIPEFVYEVIRRLPRFATMRV